MNQYTLFVLLSPFGLTFSLIVAIYCWHRRNSRAARPLAITMSAVACYLLANTIELVTPDPGLTLFMSKICYLFISVITISWFQFAVDYTNREKWFPARQYWILWIIPAITLILVFTNEVHHLIWEEYKFIPVGVNFLLMRVVSYGSWFWIFWLQSYLLILGGSVLILWSNLIPGKAIAMQSRWAIAGALLPLIVNMIYVLHLVPGFIKDYSPLTYAFGGILLAVSIFRYGLLDLAPLARSALIDHMSDAMITLDTQGKIADFNPAAKTILAGIQELKYGEMIPYFLPFIIQLKNSHDSRSLEKEMALTVQKELRHFGLNIRALVGQRSETIGYLISLHDITEYKQLLEKSNQLAMHDALTGTLNRRSFVEQANHEIERRKASKDESALIMLDIDLFKQINDTMGHLVGDQALVAFSNQLRLYFRSTDLIARFGGDEFIIFLPGTSLEDARILAENLRRQIEAGDFLTAEFGSIHFTISIGISEVNVLKSSNIEDSIEEADRSLYRAKRTGRNQVCVHD